MTSESRAPKNRSLAKAVPDTPTVAHPEAVTNGPIICRPAQPADLRAVSTLHIRSWQQAYRGMMPQDHLDSLDVEAAVARRVGNWPPPGTHVAELNSRIAGWLGIGPYRDEDAPPGSGEIYAIYVDPAHWANGVGRALMSYGLALLADQQLQPVFLWVLLENAQARRFYERHGFAADGAQEDYEVGGARVPEVRYRRDEPTEVRRDDSGES